MGITARLSPQQGARAHGVQLGARLGGGLGAPANRRGVQHVQHQRRRRAPDPRRARLSVWDLS